MARKHWWSFLVNEEGQPINNADISIYLAGTSIAATVYLDEFSTESESTVPQVKSNSNGYFEFWLPDPSDADAYDATQKFKIEWDKLGIEYGYIDYIDIYPPMIPVDESSTDTTKDKVINNKLANLWELHRLDDSHTVHGIEEVNLGEPSDTAKNRLVSNSSAFKWEKHSSITFASSGISGETYTAGLSATGSDYPHGIEPLDLSDTIQLTDSDYWVMNRLISHHYGKKWNDHVEDDDIHKTKANRSVSSSDWALSGSEYIVDITHTLSEDYPLIQMWDSDTRTVATSANFESLSPSSIRITNPSSINAYVLLFK